MCCSLIFTLSFRTCKSIVVHFIFSDKNEVKEELQADDAGKLPANGEKRTASEVGLQLA